MHSSSVLTMWLLRPTDDVTELYTPGRAVVPRGDFLVCLLARDSERELGDRYAVGCVAHFRIAASVADEDNLC
jgi:hypothetical protein